VSGEVVVSVEDFSAFVARIRLRFRRIRRTGSERAVDGQNVDADADADDFRQFRRRAFRISRVRLRRTDGDVLKLFFSSSPTAEQNKLERF
jgi:hypothetical protein